MSKANITLNDFQIIKFILVRNGIRSGNARCKERRTSQMINEKAFDLKSVYLSMSPLLLVNNPRFSIFTILSTDVIRDCPVYLLFYQSSKLCISLSGYLLFDKKI